ncbi:hypothetical protein I8752_11380 [Nostocaceae cyanobacterium CENA369]|uniref:Uncharacterized protein n=1 Tax=Dendronalium phyllosphericum CENA369 TaxID=1725256 RepID=A0A8J7I5U9_9NOST|nr:hypothetical protein [Dendronalium phyllosphericum]MBH8573606.1 hypothetical protein [Dendronalium phyllosphericum CENA369]
MMREFLEVYGQAINLDGKQYDSYFSHGIDRSDFLLFDSQVVCEVKDIQNIKVQHQVEKLARKSNISKQNFQRDFYNSINKALSKANGQIEESKKALGCTDALGLVILENLIEDDLSVLSLIDASNRKMLGGLVHIDVVLCLDMVNTFSNSEGKPVRPVKAVMRDTERARKLSKFLQQLMSDFCNNSDTPLYYPFTIKMGEQVWSTNQYGIYQGYKAKFNLQSFEPEVNTDWKKQIAQFLNKWWWVIPLPAILYDWFIR